VRSTDARFRRLNKPARGCLSDVLSPAGASANRLVSLTYTAPDSTSTAVSCSPDTVAVGQSVTCTATVTDTESSGQTRPTGTVKFEYSVDAKHSANLLSFGTTFVTVVPARSTSTSVSCSPGTVAVGTPSTCTATVTDTAAGTATTPTGVVTVSSSGRGALGGNPCTLSQASPGLATCSVSYTPGASGSTRTDTITASYGGDAIHTGSSGTAAVRVQPTSKADCRHGGWRTTASATRASASNP